MAKQTSSRGRGQDRRKVAGGQDYEVNYESNKTGTSAKKVKQAIKEAGSNERSRLRKNLRNDSVIK